MSTLKTNRIENLTTTDGGISINNSGNVGIGTTSPTRKLHVYDASTAYIQLTTAGSTQSASGGFQIVHNGAGDLRANLIQRENAPMTFSTNDTEQMRIDSSGRLLIGKTSTSNTFPLQVQAVSDTNAISISGRSSDDSSEITFYENDDSTILGQIQHKRDHVRFRHRVGYIRFDTAGTDEKMRIDSSGRLLVNTTTSRIVEDHAGNGPQGKIQIEGTNSDAIMSIISASTIDANRCGTLSLGRHRNNTVGGTPTVVNSGDSLGAICFAGGDGTDMRTKAAKIVCQVDGTPGANDMPGRLVFSTTADGAASPTERMRILSDGQIWLGSSSSTYNVLANHYSAAKLHISGGGSGSANIEIHGSSHSSLAKTITFNTDSNERMRIRSDGHILIGTTTFAGGGGITLRNDGILSAPSIYSTGISSGRDMYMDGTGYFGYISSVRESKTNIQVQNNVDWLYQLEPVTFNYKTRDRETGEYTGDAESELEYGLIAEDVETVCPDLCFYDETDDGPELRGVSYKKLITPMLKALQDAKAEIDTLKAEVAALKSN